MQSILTDFADNILDVDADVAQLWGCLCAPSAENAMDKLIAATAMIHDLVVVTRNRRHFAATGVPVRPRSLQQRRARRNRRHFAATGVPVLNPFSGNR